MTSTFRAATEADLPTLIDMQRDFYARERIAFDEASAPQSMRTLMHDPSLGRLMVIEEQGTIAGYFAIVYGFSMEFRGRSALLDELYVAPSARNRTHGTQALRFAEEMCVDEGVKVLQLEVHRTNVRANALYTRSGFFDRENLLLSKRIP